MNVREVRRSSVCVCVSVSVLIASREVERAVGGAVCTRKCGLCAYAMCHVVDRLRSECCDCEYGFSVIVLCVSMCVSPKFRLRTYRQLLSGLRLSATVRRKYKT